MDIESYIQEAIFGENEQHTCFYQLIWDTFKESGFVITDEDGHEIDAIFKATAIQNLLGEFMYSLYDEVNETGFEDVIDYVQTLGYGDEDILNYCKSDPEIEVDENDFDLTVKNALDYITEIIQVITVPILAEAPGRRCQTVINTIFICSPKSSRI